MYVSIADVGEMQGMHGRALGSGAGRIVLDCSADHVTSGSLMKMMSFCTLSQSPSLSAAGGGRGRAAAARPPRQEGGVGAWGI